VSEPSCFRSGLDSFYFSGWKNPSLKASFRESLGVIQCGLSSSPFNSFLLHSRQFQVSLMGVGRAILSRDLTFLSAFNPIWFITLGNQSARFQAHFVPRSAPSWPPTYFTRPAGTMLAARWVFLKGVRSPQCSWTFSFTSWTSSYLSPSSGCRRRKNYLWCHHTATITILPFI